MTSFKGGTKVEGGYYWNTAKWSVSTIDGDAGTLEGTTADSYLRLPLPVMLAVVVTVSFGYAMFLPFIGFALFAQAIAVKVTGLFTDVASETAATMAPAWQPGAAYFAGKPGEKAEAKPAGDELHKLEAEIAEKRAEETDKKA